MEYSNAKAAITLCCLNEMDPRLTHKLRSASYINDQKPGLGTFTEDSPNRLKIDEKGPF